MLLHLESILGLLKLQLYTGCSKSISRTTAHTNNARIALKPGSWKRYGD